MFALQHRGEQQLVFETGMQAQIFTVSFQLSKEPVPGSFCRLWAQIPHLHLERRL